MKFTKTKIYSIEDLTDSDLSKIRRTIRKVYTEMPSTHEDYNFLVEFLTHLDTIQCKNVDTVQGKN